MINKIPFWKEYCFVMLSEAPRLKLGKLKLLARFFGRGVYPEPVERLPYTRHPPC